MAPKDINPEHIVEALCEQRNAALNGQAQALAFVRALQRDLDVARARISELEHQTSSD